jgi:glutamine synthetase
VIPIVATEIEFTLFGSAERDLEAFWDEVRARSAQLGIAIANLEKERGREQHEVSLKHSRDVAKIISDTEQLKKIITECAGAYDMQASFAAKPVADDPGNGLHIHVHLEDENGKNLYWKKDDAMSDALAHSIAGLLTTLPENLPVFVPNEESKKRFVAGSNAPTTISWGANNRTCAIRLPDKPAENKHIEHRVSGADADVGAVVAAILSGIEFGIEHKLIPSPQVYGDASLPMYGLPKLFPDMST